jgi:hypothetical protein
LQQASRQLVAQQSTYSFLPPAWRSVSWFGLISKLKVKTVLLVTALRCGLHGM